MVCQFLHFSAELDKFLCQVTPDETLGPQDGVDTVLVRARARAHLVIDTGHVQEVLVAHLLR